MSKEKKALSFAIRLRFKIKVKPAISFCKEPVPGFLPCSS
jgi:hypothetical protein